MSDLTSNIYTLYIDTPAVVKNCGHFIGKNL